MVKGQELVAVVCERCGDIRVMNLETGENHIAYISKKGPHRLCHGEVGRMWVVCRRDDTVRELNCSSKTFTETGRTVNTTLHCDNMCYLPTPHRALILSHYHKWIEAVSCETGQQLWSVAGLSGAVTFHPQHQLLLVARTDTHQILALDPKTGSTAHTFYSYLPRHFCWSRGRLLVLHTARTYISHLQLIDEEKGESCDPVVSESSRSFMSIVFAHAVGVHLRYEKSNIFWRKPAKAWVILSMARAGKGHRFPLLDRTQQEFVSY